LNRKHHAVARKKTRDFLALLYVTSLTYATMYSPQPLLSTIQRVFPQYTSTTIALVMTLPLGLLSVAPLFYGSFLSVWKTRTVLLISVSGMALSGFGLFLHHDLAGILTFRLLQSILIPAVFTCIMAHISSCYSGQELQRALAIYIGVSIMGGLLGRIGAGVISSLIGWRYVFLVFALMQAVGLFLLRPLQNTQQSRFTRVCIPEFLAILKKPIVAQLLFIDACGFFVFAAVANYLPFRLSAINTNISDWIISLMYVGYGIGVFLAFGSRRTIALMRGETRAIFLGVSIYFCTLPGFCTESLWGTALIMCCVCIGQFMEHSISPGLINRSVDMDKGAVNGLYLSVYYLGGTLGSFVPGLIYRQWGWNAFIGVLACVLFVAVVISAKLARTHSEKVPA
jgi:YNFM family putative membrane transporter